jgi:hydrogenase maturation protease
MRILIAGIGNIFMGDDAFGCRVADDLAHHDMPDQVQVQDFGIRSYDLAYAMMEDYDAVIVIDAMVMGERPGTVSLVDADKADLKDLAVGEPDTHSMNPLTALRLVKAMGGVVGHLYVVGCEPAVMGIEEIGLSEPVRAAVPSAVAMVEDLVHELIKKRPDPFPRGLFQSN